MTEIEEASKKFRENSRELREHRTPDKHFDGMEGFIAEIAAKHFRRGCKAGESQEDTRLKKDREEKLAQRRDVKEKVNNDIDEEQAAQIEEELKR